MSRNGMQADIQETQEESARWLKASWLALAAGVLVSTWGWWQTGQSIQQDADAQFEAQTQGITQHLEQLVDHHLDVLISFQALFRVTGAAPLDSFVQHYRALKVDQEYPALLAVQYAPKVQQADKGRFEAQVQAQYPNYRITPPGERAYYARSPGGVMR